MRNTSFAIVIVVFMLCMAYQVHGQITQPEYLSGSWKFQGGNVCDAASHAEFRLEGNTGKVLTRTIIFDRACDVFKAGYRAATMFERIGPVVFQHRDPVTGENLTLEFDGNVIIQTIGGSSKSYWMRQ